MPHWVTAGTQIDGRTKWVGTIIILLASLRLCHVGLLWSDEDYHLAAALSLLHGKVPYRDFWYDKPPLSALYYVLIGARWGVLVRLLDAVTVVLGCYVTARIASELWGKAEAYVAALLLAFFSTFYLPAAVIPFAADAVMLVPHVAAVYCGVRHRPLAAGIWAGVAFLANTKAVFVLASCALWCLPQLLMVLGGFAVPLLAAAIALLGLGAWPAYWEQVWHWSLLYAKETPIANPLRTGIKAVSDWAGFHAAAVLPATFALAGKSAQRWKLMAWLVFSFGAVCLGARFAPRYFLQLLPPVVVLAAHGWVLLYQRFLRRAYFAAVLLLIPFVRFAPRYAELARDLVLQKEPAWSDVQMDLDSRHVADQLRGLATKNDTLFVWGYRPDIYVYSRLLPDGRFTDSQPLTGVPADRHLTISQAIDQSGAAVNRRAFTHTEPTFFVDGLGQLNPALQPSRFPELRPWLANYQLVGRTALSLIYKRRSNAQNLVPFSGKGPGSKQSRQ